MRTEEKKSDDGKEVLEVPLSSIITFQMCFFALLTKKDLLSLIRSMKSHESDWLFKLGLKFVSKKNGVVHQDTL